MNQDNNTFIANNQNTGVPNTVLPAAPTVSVTNPPVQQPTTESVVATQPSTNSNVLICSKCGSEMKKESRYCMKCGNLNYAHPDNESMKQYAWQNIKQGYFISGANVDNNQSLPMTNSNSISDSHPFRACVITNVILHILLAASILLAYNASLSALGISLPVGAIVGVVIGVLIGFVFNYSVQAMFIKAGEPWWGYYVPFYGNYILYKISMGNGWLFLTSIIPIVGWIIALMAVYHLGKKFYKNGILTVLFPYVMIPIIAFDKNTEYSLLARAVNDANASVDASGQTQSEKAYGRKKILITLIVVIIIAVILYFVWPYVAPIVEKIYDMIMEKI